MADGGIVVRTVELVSCFSDFSDHASLSLRALASLYERWGMVVLFEHIWI